MKEKISFYDIVLSNPLVYSYFITEWSKTNKDVLFRGHICININDDLILLDKIDKTYIIPSYADYVEDELIAVYLDDFKKALFDRWNIEVSKRFGIELPLYGSIKFNPVRSNSTMLPFFLNESIYSGLIKGSLTRELQGLVERIKFVEIFNS